MDPDENTPLFGQSGQSLKYKKSLLRNVPAASTAGGLAGSPAPPLSGVAS